MRRGSPRAYSIASVGRRCASARVRGGPPPPCPQHQNLNPCALRRCEWHRVRVAAERAFDPRTFRGARTLRGSERGGPVTLQKSIHTHTEEGLDPGEATPPHLSRLSQQWLSCELSHREPSSGGWYSVSGGCRRSAPENGGTYGPDPGPRSDRPCLLVDAHPSSSVKK